MWSPHSLQISASWLRFKTSFVKTWEMNIVLHTQTQPLGSQHAEATPQLLPISVIISSWWIETHCAFDVTYAWQPERMPEAWCWMFPSWRTISAIFRMSTVLMTCWMMLPLPWLWRTDVAAHRQWWCWFWILLIEKASPALYFSFGGRVGFLTDFETG